MKLECSRSQAHCSIFYAENYWLNGKHLIIQNTNNRKGIPKKYQKKKRIEKKSI